MLNYPECDSEYSYEDGIAFVCPECAHELIQMKSAKRW